MPDQTYAVHDAAGTLLSTGTVVADPLPDGLTAKALTDAEAAAMAAGATWNTATLTFDPPPPAPPFPPMDPTGAGVLATLLVVEGVLPIDDAAHSVGTVPEHLVHEAQSWSVGA